MLWLDGVYEEGDESPPRKPRLRRARAPTSAQLTHLADTIAHRVCRLLARKGWLEGDDESAFLSERAAGNDGMDALLGSSMPRKRTDTQAHARPHSPREMLAYLSAIVCLPRGMR